MKRRGFTLIEITVVIFLLLLIAAAVVPNAVAFQRSRDLKDREADIARLPAEARNEAVRTQTPVRLRVDNDALVLEQIAPDGGAQLIKQVALGDAVQVESVEENGEPSDTGSWQWTVSPDGSAENGGIQFVEGAARRALLLSAEGDARWIAGDLPDGTPDRWPAGQLQQRA